MTPATGEGSARAGCLASLAIWPVSSQATARAVIRVDLCSPIDFPQSSSWTFAVAGHAVKFCALARAADDDQIFGALSDEVPVVEGENTHVTMTLAPMEEAEIPSECAGGLVDAGPLGDG